MPCPLHAAVSPCAAGETVPYPCATDRPRSQSPTFYHGHGANAVRVRRDARLRPYVHRIPFIDRPQPARESLATFGRAGDVSLRGIAPRIDATAPAAGRFY